MPVESNDIAQLLAVIDVAAARVPVRKTQKKIQKEGGNKGAEGGRGGDVYG